VSQRAREKKRTGVSDFSNIRAFFSEKKNSSESFLSCESPPESSSSKEMGHATRQRSSDYVAQSVGRSVVHEVKDDNRFPKQTDQMKLPMKSVSDRLRTESVSQCVGLWVAGFSAHLNCQRTQYRLRSIKQHLYNSL
jgi:hypothetical protein